jgi:hypothetical protein
MVSLRALVPASLLAGLMFGGACGGGGGGGTSGGGATLVGRVLQVETGGPPNPQASVQVGSRSTLTDPGDGSFQLGVPTGTAALTVDTMTQTSGVWQFAFAPASGVTDVGDLWVGPERVTLRGTVRDSTNNGPVPGATVAFGGRSGATDAFGVFNLTDVAYSSQTQTAFWGIVGTVRASGFFRTDFSAQPNVAIGGVVDVGDIFITPLSDPNPPTTPFNIWGMVSAQGGPQGAIVRLKVGGNDVRVFNVGADGRYLFFVVPGTYTISASKGAQTAPDQQVTLTSANQVIRRDFNLQ